MTARRNDERRYLDPKVLARISGLELRARLIVEGFLSGMHHSPHRGLSVEFADHRAYTQGDDLRHIDWKVYGKTDKYYVKEYEQETNLDVLLAVDASESMAYRSSEAALSKYDYAVSAAAAVAYLTLRQHDAVGLAVFDDGVRTFLRPSNQAHRWRAIVERLSEGTGAGTTSLGSVLHEITERLRRRTLVVVVSDLFDDPDAVLKGIRFLRHRRHELILWNVWDRAERTLEMSGPTMFEGLEMSGRLPVDPSAVRARYLEEVRRFLTRLRAGCAQMQVEYTLFDTSQPLDAVLSGYLAARSARLRRRSARVTGGSG
ncbi:MAG: DUF58 domain-containing protein [Planctomycetota bacterium]|nr:MAG: DUF58 domain-containing protein [Planctomycetota bacterium]